MSAPLLTAGMAGDLVYGWAPALPHKNALQALADGRTRCVEVLDEAGHRARFIQWARGAYTKDECACDPQGVFFNPDVSERWGSWLACARAMGAVSEKKGEKG